MMDWKDELLKYISVSRNDDLKSKEISKLKYENIPKKLFKYRPVTDYSVENFKNGTLWFAGAETFNDPYDTTLYFNQERLNTIKSKRVKEVLREGMRSINSDIKRGYKICCLSEELHSMPMWYHYANRHRGFVMEFDFSILAERDTRTSILWPVFYSEKLFDASDFLLTEGKGGDSNLLLGILSSINKSEDWQYEKEWRLILTKTEDADDLNQPIPKPTAIYFGKDIQNSDRLCLMEIAESKNIPAYCMELSETDFKMIPHSLKI